MSHLLDRIPHDIWDDILRYACTDGGRTGAALASTSYGIREASAARRFYSLKLTSLAEIGKLLLCFDRMERAQGRLRPSASMEDRLKTHHLLLSFFPEDCESLVRPWRGWSEYSRRRTKRQLQMDDDERAWQATKGAWDRQFVYLVSQLFRLIAPSLETLVILQHTGIPLPLIAGIDFPMLRELSLLADDCIFARPKPMWESHAALDSPNQHDSHFPSLTHLHIVFEGPKQHSWERTLPLWTRLAPALTHVRVSQALNLIPEVLEEISSNSFPRSVDSSGPHETLTFPKLKAFLIQPWVFQPVTGHEHVRESSVLSKAPKGRGPGLVVMRGRRYRNGYWRDRLSWEWEDRILGLPGCWSEHEDDEGEWAYERRKISEVAAQKVAKSAHKHASNRGIGRSIQLDSPAVLWRLLSGSFLRQVELTQAPATGSLWAAR
ncbi:hypothetical protein C8Q78DRAFT_1075180 [Trametes maxima]|nr:hypothetical protein C8Q78DRAFT_1075180 [Trametes maxima]